jgi:hypothetical protein
MMLKPIHIIFLLSVLLINSANADDVETLTMRMIETFLVPDSVYSPDMGIFCGDLMADDFVNNYRRENGLDDFEFKGKYRNAGKINSEYSDKPNIIHFRVEDLKGVYIWRATDNDSNEWVIKEIRLKEGDYPELGSIYKNLSNYDLSKNGRDICRFRTYSKYYPANPIYQMLLHDQDCVICYQTSNEIINIEYDNKFEYLFHLIINGVDLNEKYDYDICIAAAYFRDHLFYLFEKDDEWSWSFNGVEGSECYERVYHNWGDGEGSVFFNPSGYNGFYALRDGMWYFVIGQVVDESE